MVGRSKGHKRHPLRLHFGCEGIAFELQHITKMVRRSAVSGTACVALHQLSGDAVPRSGPHQSQAHIVDSGNTCDHGREGTGSDAWTSCETVYDLNAGQRGVADEPGGLPHHDRDDIC